MRRCDPKQEFKREAFELFATCWTRIKSEVVQMLARVRIRSEEESRRWRRSSSNGGARGRAMQFQHAETSGFATPPAEAGAAAQPGVREGAAVAVMAPVTRESPKVGRNEPCPCGSGKKYKHCHGALN